uniref:Uncharacterized protein n=1 Tax=Leptobrachium leishanense TaxID=445787 RepID=A0A8C5LVC4_9ANUR
SPSFFCGLRTTEGTCGGVLRGTGRQKIGAIMNAVGYYLVGLPIGISLMFAAKLGVVGLWIGMITCVFLQASFYCAYVLRLNWNKAVEEAQVRAGVKKEKPDPVPTTLQNETNSSTMIENGKPTMKIYCYIFLQIFRAKQVIACARSFYITTIVLFSLH